MAINPVSSGSDIECRDQILETAGDLFETKGMQKTTVREIARRAGYTTGAVYFHFANKEAIYFQILLSFASDLKEQVKKASGEKSDPFSAVMAGFLAYVRFFDDKPGELCLSLISNSNNLAAQEMAVIAQEFTEIRRCFSGHISRFGIDPSKAELETNVLMGDMVGLVLTLSQKGPGIRQPDTDRMTAVHLERLGERMLSLVRQTET